MPSQSSFFMIQIYRFYKLCVLLSLCTEPSYFAYLISYTNGIIIVQNEWHIFIHPSCGCVPCTIFWVFYLWHEIVSWDCRFYHVIFTCRLCHCTAVSGFHKYVRLKMDGLLEPWQTLKYEVCFDFCVWCVLHQWKSTASWWRCMEMCNTRKTGRHGAWLSTVAGQMMSGSDLGIKHVHYRWCVAYRHA